ncbi:hypothetical protein BDA96_04G004000 [Sorghum bicolor]|uniref:Uncharacterized protein n=1 Tax=Sorghum bicolor TaxID=4558 RepID=A0A921UIM7_SORBI|nr:hypothetical protein BDA96_04G004000 [Sorghum bicolor]
METKTDLLSLSLSHHLRPPYWSLPSLPVQAAGSVSSQSQPPAPEALTSSGPSASPPLKTRVAKPIHPLPPPPPPPSIPIPIFHPSPSCSHTHLLHTCNSLEVTSQAKQAALLPAQQQHVNKPNQASPSPSPPRSAHLPSLATSNCPVGVASEYHHHY